jgi:hypothetical protein
MLREERGQPGRAELLLLVLLLVLVLPLGVLVLPLVGARLGVGTRDPLLVRLLFGRGWGLGVR